MIQSSDYKTLVHALGESVQRNPDSEAVLINDQRTSYSELWNNVIHVAGYLREHGFKSGDRASLLIENTVEYISAYYGVLLAGGVVVGLNAATKARDLTNWVKHSETSWLFARASHPELPMVENNCAQSVRIVSIGDSQSNKVVASHILWQDIQSADLKQEDFSLVGDIDKQATIIYTSGTTGQPKGVTLSHANLAANIKSIQEYLNLTASDRIMNVLPFYYSYGNSVLHTHMAVGGSIVLENSLMFPHKVLEAMAEERVTGFSGVPSTFSLLLSRTKLSDYDLSTLRYMTQAGGAMAPASIKRLLELLPHIDFYVMYGQTEASARLSYLPPERLKDKLGSIGKAIPGVTLEVRDQNGNATPVGETGEIWAKGENIMLGYWKDEEATRKSITDGWLRTGDLAHTDDEDYLYIDGRSSEMIKSGANRISPKDIEEVIAELSSVEEVAAIGVPDEIMGQIIKVIIVLAPGEAESKKKIMLHCRQNLAMYKVPKQIEFATELPKTASGKIKRYKLQ